MNATHKQRANWAKVRAERADLMEARRCEECGGELPPDSRSDRRTCSETCAQRRRLRKRGREEIRLRRHESKLREYGLTVKAYARMLVDQDGGCAICGKQCPTGRLLAVDHCHETGAVRGLLCANCNHGIGMFKDSPELLRKAITYLEESRE